MAEIKVNRRWVQSVLRHETTVWTPSCPDPETLLDWLEQPDTHPEADRLLAHLFSCAHCRQQRVSLREIRALSTARQLAAAGRIDPRILGALPPNLENWVRELIADGFTQPVASMRAAFRQLAARTASRGPAAAWRGEEAPVAISPVGTAVRAGRLTLNWSGEPNTREYEIDILQLQRSAGFPRSVWHGTAGAKQELTLPAELQLEPGTYEWQVTAHVEDRKAPSGLAGFVVLKPSMLHEIELLERGVEDSPLARISLYEAYGLYDEAMQLAERVIDLNADDEAACRIHSKLLQRLSTAIDPPTSVDFT